MEAIEPIDPDVQRETLLKDIEKEQKMLVREEDLQRLHYYRTVAIEDHHFEPFPKEYLVNARKRIAPKYFSKLEYRIAARKVEEEIQQYYCYSARQTILEYILLDQMERKRLNIETYPIKYPSILIRSPVPWHCNKVLAEQRLLRNLFIGNPVFEHLNKLWDQKYEDVYILPFDKLMEEGLPLRAKDFEEKVERFCWDARTLLIKEWVPSCANIVKEMKHTWSHLVPKKSDESFHGVEKFFSCVAAFMSMQMRSLVMRSLLHFCDNILTYEDGNYYEEPYEDFMFINISLITTQVKNNEGTTDLYLDPSMREIRDLLYRCFTKVINVNKNIPRVEAILFEDMADYELLAVSVYEEQVSNIIADALDAFDANNPGPLTYTKTYEVYNYIFSGEARSSLQAFFDQEFFPPLKDFEQKIKMYKEICEEITFLRKMIPLNLFCLDCTELNNQLYNMVDGLRKYIVDYFMTENRSHNRGICNVFDQMSFRASELPETTAELVELTNYLLESRDSTMFKLKSKIQQTAQCVLFLMNQAILPVEDIQLNSRVFLWPNDMESVLELATQRLSHRRDAVENVLRARRIEFDETLTHHQKLLDSFRKKDPPLLTMEEMTEAVEGVESLVKKLKNDKKEAESINEEEQLLEWEITPFMNLGNMLLGVEPYQQLWRTVYDWHINNDKWYYGPFKGLDDSEIRDEVEAVWRLLYKLAKTFHDVPGSKRVAEIVRAKVEKFRQYIPVLQTICNPGLQERHWQQMSQLLGIEIDHPDDASLHDMIEIGMIKYVAKLEEISVAATKEYALERALEKMKMEWDDVVFVLNPYRQITCDAGRETGVYILSSIDDIQIMLDDHILKAQTMRGSPYVKPFEAQMQAWEDKLISMQDILDAWLLCQSTWMYLEPIFSSEDIMRQMPEEARKFKKVDKIWKNLMKNTLTDTRVLIATGQLNMLRNLRECNTLLDEIQKGLNDYLEKKRLFFPRFFFLSNDELLEILSETKDPMRVQPHLKKCFEGISRLEFTPDEEIVAMVSAENEVVPLSGKIVPAEAKGMVERWLSQVESFMLQSVREICIEAVSAYVSSNRQDWVLSWPGQVVICGSTIHWTAEVSEAIEANTLKLYLDKSNTQIEKLIQLVRTPLNSGSRITICALIVIDVHARDVVGQLKNLNVDQITDFNWISQLRYYWRESTVIVSMITTDVNYGFEYLGNTPRLVITPLTDRCYRTLMGALRLNLGGAPEGPAGTGKTETSKDLAKALAKQCVVFNCSDGLDYKAMGKFFKGLAQSGAWACFDEFNRIELEVLSVIAQQIQTIQLAIQQKLEKFMFEGTELSLNPNCNIIITMNPGYAGRQELPDNLKVLFRTVAMMVPDYALIGEISLYSMGFDAARSLAEKIVDTYKLCSEQLSSQHHYDYGMRAVKTVLTAAGNLKLKYPTSREATLVLRAIVDVNLPKFLSEDVPLFEGIISDLFPGVVLPKPDRDELVDQLVISCKKRNLQATPWYLEKIIQVYEMILVRHGLMIVGEPLGGKTMAYQSLAESLGELNQDKKATMKEFKVQYRIINPKAITMGQLYGCFDPVSHEWYDGVLANTFREFASSTSLDRKWIMFDGPIDAVWIENMNTVLDDNKKLCLMSGEIIQMSNKMNLIFEPADLEQASPATVSRCGMIYLEPHKLGWRAIHESFNNRLREKLIPEQVEILDELIDWLVEPTLSFINHNAKRFVNSSGLHLFMMYTKLLTCMLEGESQFATVWLQCTFLFCLVWGFGGTMNGDSRKKFDVWFRKLLLDQDENNPRPKMFKLAKNQLFPEKGTVFDFVYDKKNNGTWINWLDTLDKAAGNYPPTAKVSELIIPTNETCCQKFFLENFISRRMPLLFVGPTGTGKSAIVLSHLMSLPKDKYLPNVINFSARTSANQTQEIIMSKLDRRRKGVFGPAMGKQCVLFVDDLSMPQKEIYGAQPPIELLRQWIDHSHWYDPKDTSKLELVDILFVGGMLPAGGGSNEITSRFVRHQYIVGIESFEESTLTKIFGSIMEWHLNKNFDDTIKRLGKALVGATLDVYQNAIVSFLPTPAKSHYLFNLRDFSRVVRGVLLCPSTHMVEAEKFVRLWIHESYRVFQDRLIDEKDKNTFFGIVQRAVVQNFRMPIEKVCTNLMPEGENELKDSHIRNLFFGNYIEPDADPKIYNEISDLEDLAEKMTYYLNEYNMISRTPMSLVIFKFAMEHISRVSRVLLQESGHCLLVGIGGSGRQSATKMAAAMSEYFLFQIEIARQYSTSDWREDLKTLLKKCGNENKPSVFLFCDSQIKDEGFVEDINMLLNTGDVPNLFGGEEKAEILEKMTAALQSLGKKMEMTPLTLYNFFVERVRQNLHISLAMSPIGEAFRVRLRMFPSLVNCCTIDWFMAWPEDALEKVAKTFLTPMGFEEELTEKCVSMCKIFHTTVEDMSDKFFKALRRKNYVTPTSYLELIKTFQNLYGKKVDQITLQRNRYEVGLDKLDFAASQVSVMQEELHALQPQLIVTSEKTEKLMIKIEQDTVVVEAKKEIVGADEALANEAAAAAQAIKDDCESDLSEAIPALEAAINALNTLKPADITVVKSMKNPPYGVKLVMESICVMKQIKPERKPDPGGSGRMIEDYWGPSQKLLGDLKFLDSLKAYDKDNIPPQVIKRIRERFIPDRDFDPNNIKQVSAACEGLCKWVRAMEVYDRVIKIVAPKKAKLEEAEAELAVQMETLNAKRAQLQEVTDKLQALNDEFAAMTKQKKELEDNIELCSQKLDRAEKLIGGLGGEKHRWSQTAKLLQETLDNVVGDVLLSAGFVAYLGAFTVFYRQEIIKKWNDACYGLGVPCSQSFSLTQTLGEPVLIRQWNICGLPVDNYSVENGIIVKNAKRWPLMIDPQGQANKWIKNLERENRLGVIKLTDSNYGRVVEQAIQYGTPIILENILEDIDPALDPVLQRNVFKQGGIEYLNIGDNLIPYNHDFRFYITTRLRNPHYLPEVVVKVTLLNFMITRQGLQDQLLGTVVAKERPDLEEKKNMLILESANNKKMLEEIEDKILQVLSSSEGNILEDETANQILTSSKVLSEEIQAKQKVAVVTEEEIDHARNLYKPVSEHSSVLFFCISDLATLDPMYQYSLPWFINLYNLAIENSEKSSDLEERMSNLNNYFTSSIYKNVCRSLFEKDKLIFSFALTIGIQRSRNEVDEDIFVFFLTGGVALSNPYPNPAPTWLSEKAWSEITRATLLPGLGEFKKSVETQTLEWKKFYDSSTPQDETFPKPLKNLDGLQRLVVLRCIRPDKVVPAVQNFIVNYMGQSYVEPPVFNLVEIYSDSSCITPLLFILSAGSDPMMALLKFAESKGKKRTIQAISLGQGQGPIAAKMIYGAIKAGTWVVLQNCHLAESWMRELDRITQEVIVPDATHKEFRLWLTSYPSNAFPVSILQNGVKMTNEAPKGLKLNLLKSYTSDPVSNPAFYDGCTQPEAWQKLLFALVFFHALVQERRMFGPLGWNIPYEFNESDLRISIMQLQMFLNEYDSIPFHALTYLTGECNYGGRVTDDKDRRLLNSLLSTFYCIDAIEVSEYTFSESGTYYIPPNTEHASIVEYIRSLPLNPKPEVFGLHENADITKDNNETLMLLRGVLLTQPQIGSGQGGEEKGDLVSELAGGILRKVPNKFDLESVGKKYPIQYMNSMNTVLKQELIRFNRLIEVVKNSLINVRRAIAGEVVMTPQLEEVNRSLIVGRVPGVWASKSYPSLKPLGGYITDFLLRLKFLQDWIDEGTPVIFWLSGFYFTQSFLTGVLQNFSRSKRVPIDKVGFQFEITEHEADAKLKSDPPYGVYTRQQKKEEEEHGVFVDGLFIEGARWDRQTRVLAESYPKILFDCIPIIWFKPGVKATFVPVPWYRCPIYKTSARRGVLSTTGHSTNFVMFMEVNSDKPEKHWINRGVAILCALDD
ncbi:hypothetical protein RUM44_011244 [Polyplax serrata]|uniref:AAA+ ATPase domain-containing protein n=1 Tax=Polyplax serrata TaxID=468196 RepID=A0ABR1APH1_POLSC